MEQKNLLNLVNGTLEKGCVLAMSTATPMVEALEFQEIQGNALTFNVVDALVPTEHRELGQDVEAVEIEPKKATVSLKILTNSVKTDRALNCMSDVTEIHAQQQEIAMKSSGKALEKQVFARLEEDLTGDVSGKEFTGALTLDLVDDAMDYVSPTRTGNIALFVNPKTKRALTKLFKEDGYIATNIEAFGQLVPCYDNKPILVSDDIADNVIYVVRFGLDAVHGITNGGLKVYAENRGVFMVSDTEMLYNIVCKTKNAFAKVKATPMRALKK